MGSKKYRNKLCVYCAVAPSTTGDHVFARSLFAESRRENLPQVPACKACNEEKSDLEHYLASVLPFGGRHSDAKHVLETDVHRRLLKNVPLHRALAEGMQRVTIKAASGESEESLTIPFDGKKLQRWLAFVVRGLMWHHWKVVLSQEHDARVMVLAEYGREVFLTMLSKPAKQRASGDLGNGTFRYQGAQGSDYPEFSLWALDAYGGALFSGGDESGETTGALCAFTAKKTFFERPAFTSMFGDREPDRAT